MEVQDGRTIDFAEGASNPLHTAVFQIQARNEPAKDDDGLVFQGSAYVEFIRGGIEISDLSEVIRQSPEMVVFLTKANGWDLAVHTIENGGSGHPDGSELLTFTTMQGIVVMTASGLEHPWSDFPKRKIFNTQAVSLKDFEGELISMFGKT